MKKFILIGIITFIGGSVTGGYLISNYYKKQVTAAQNFIHATCHLQGECGLDATTIYNMNSPAAKNYKETEHEYMEVFHLFQDCADDGSDFTWADFFSQFI